VFGARPERVEDAGHRQAPFFRLDLAVALDDLRVDEDARVIALGVTSVTSTRSCTVDLRRGEADPLGRVHRLQHVVDELADGVVDDGHRLCLGAQTRIRILEDRKLRHSLENTAKVKSGLNLPSPKGAPEWSPTGGVARLRRGRQPPPRTPDYKATVSTLIPDGERDGALPAS
jgi:hypothetical protein